MRARFPMLRSTLLLMGLLAASGLQAQDATLKEQFVQAKALWENQGDADGAMVRLEQVLSVLEPKAKALDAEWLQVLTESYFWLAVVMDRNPAKRSGAAKRLEALLEVNPDFEPDKGVGTKRLHDQFDSLRSAKLCRVKLNILPEGGRFLVDGKPRNPAGLRFLTPGPHTVSYAKHGYRTVEQSFDLVLKKETPIELKLERNSSVVIVYTSPVGAEILLDGKRLGVSQGQAGPEAQPHADRLGITLQQLSAPFPVADLSQGTHILEVKAPCYRPRKFKIPEDWTTPFADQILDPVKLEASQGMLTVKSPVAGELTLSGKGHGSVPLKTAMVCAGTYDLLIRYPQGAFTQRIEIPEGKTVAVEARPKPRLAYLGFDGNPEFAGKDRFFKLLETLGERLTEVAFLPPVPGESVKDALARLKGAKAAELLLYARPSGGKTSTAMDLVLSTLGSEEEVYTVKPLEQSPTGLLERRLNQAPILWTPWVNLTTLDLPGEPGPWLLQADEATLKAGLKPGRPILQVNGKPVSDSAALRAAIREAAPSGKVQITQAEGGASLPVTPWGREIPVQSEAYSYPFLLVDLKLRAQGATGEELGLLRLNQALVLMHYRQFDRALETLREAKLSATAGVGAGTLDYYTGYCLQRLGGTYTAEAIVAFQQALKQPQATLFGPEGPLVAPLAKQALEELKP